MIDTSPRAKLLAAAIDHIAHHGGADRSLRALAADLGTSHRMLIYHFGSKEGLLTAVAREVEARQRAALATMLLDEDAPPAETMRRMWKQVADPALWPNERLFFEIYGQALQGRPGTVELLDGIIDAWLEPSATILAQLGFPDGPAAARLGIAVSRGLLLDLLATGGHDAVDRAMEVHIAALEAAMNAYGRHDV